METSLERIQGKISELEAQISDLRIAERELLALDQPSRQTKPVSFGAAAAVKAMPSARAKPGPRAKQKPVASPQSKAQESAGKPESISAAVSQALAEHDPLSVGEIADLITASGREINNRAISFTLQALKKRGIAKSVDGKWTSTAAKSRSKKSPAGSKNSGESAEA